MEKQITKKTNALASSTNPEEIILFGQKAAKTLKAIVSRAGWTVKIQGNDKEYLRFEAWQTLARFYGLTVKTKETRFVNYDGVKGFEARVAVLNKDGVEIGAAEAVCLNDEKNWKNKPLYSLKSMAQTRASAKALRQLLSWVVVLAGYNPTPAEEMEEAFAESENLEKPKEIKSCPECNTSGQYHRKGCKYSGVNFLAINKGETTFEKELEKLGKMNTEKEKLKVYAEEK